MPARGAQAADNVVAIVEQGLGSIRVGQTFGPQVRGRADDGGEPSTVTRAEARRIEALLSPVVTIVVALCTGFVLWRGTLLILAGTLTAGGLTVPSRTCRSSSIRTSPDDEHGRADFRRARRIQKILRHDQIIPERSDAVDPGTVKGEITFEHVAFGYSDVSHVLRDVNFTIKAGQVVGIVGPTGGGQVDRREPDPRFYDPTAGRVLIDGSDIRTWKLVSLRREIGFVLQETVLFAGTIRDNIAYGRPDASDADIIAASKLANADEFIAKMPGGYGAIVGERGDTLSGGQRQRIGIARALIRQSPILILDEPTAALDTESERLVVEGLERLMKGRTVIMIAHRLSTIRDADLIIVLKDGVVAEQGSHEELMRKNGVYAELYHIQYGTPAAKPAAASVA